MKTHKRQEKELDPPVCRSYSTSLCASFLLTWAHPSILYELLFPGKVAKMLAIKSRCSNVACPKKSPEADHRTLEIGTDSSASSFHLCTAQALPRPGYQRLTSKPKEEIARRRFGL
jgi:hypothetical protein